MQIRQLEFFLKAAETESLTRAAEELFVSQPGLCRAIRELEQELGVSLFRRAGRRKVLTEEGKLFLPYAGRIMTDLMEAREVMAGYTHTDRGEVRIAGSSGYPGVFGALAIRYYMRTGNTGVRIVESEERPHLVLCGMDDGKPGEKIPVLRQNMVLMAPPSRTDAAVIREKAFPGMGYSEPAAAGRDRILELLERHPFLAYRKGSEIRKLTDRFFRRWGIHPDILLESGEDMQLAGLAAAGLGCAILPEETAGYYVEAARRTGLGRVPDRYRLDGNVPPRLIYLRPAGGQIPACAAHFCDILQGCKDSENRI